MQALGDQGFFRLKVGIGRPPDRVDPADFVLSRFAAREREQVDAMVGDAASVLRAFTSDREGAVQLAGSRREGG